MAALTGEQIAALRNGGKSVREIADGLGVSTTTVYRWADPAFAARQNASQRRWKRRNSERAQAARDRYLERAAPRCSRCGGRLTTPTAAGDPVLCRSCLDAATGSADGESRSSPRAGQG
jgi:hypothetical protein